MVFLVVAVFVGAEQGDGNEGHVALKAGLDITAVGVGANQDVAGEARCGPVAVDPGTSAASVVGPGITGAGAMGAAIVDGAGDVDNLVVVIVVGITINCVNATTSFATIGVEDIAKDAAPTAASDATAHHLQLVAHHTTGNTADHWEEVAVVKEDSCRNHHLVVGVASFEVAIINVVDATTDVASLMLAVAIPAGRGIPTSWAIVLDLDTAHKDPIKALADPIRLADD